MTTQMKKLCPECESIQEFIKLDDLEWCESCGTVVLNPLTTEQMTELKRCANRIFDGIYHDIPDAEDLPMEDLVEIAFDAGRLQEHNPQAYINWQILIDEVGYRKALSLVAKHRK